MTNPSPATTADHDAAIAALAGAATTAELAAELATWQHLDRPGFARDLPDGRYYDGFFFATKRGSEIAMTREATLPEATWALWQQMHDEQLAAREQVEVFADLDEPNRGGRPPIGKPLLVRIPDWRRNITKADAAAAGVSEAELVRWLVERAYSQLGADARDAGVERTDLIRARIRP